MGHLLPDARGWRVSWAMMAEVARGAGDACFPHNLGRRLLPDVCGYAVSRTASVDVCSKRDVLRLPLGACKTGLSHLVILFTDRSKAVLLLLFIFMCYNIYNVCLLHDFVATLRLSALPSALYFVLSKLAL